MSETDSEANRYRLIYVIEVIIVLQRNSTMVNSTRELLDRNTFQNFQLTMHLQKR